VAASTAAHPVDASLLRFILPRWRPQPYAREFFMHEQSMSNGVVASTAGGT